MKLSSHRLKRTLSSVRALLVRPYVFIPLLAIVLAFVIIWFVANAAAQRYSESLNGYIERVEGVSINTDANDENDIVKNDKDVAAMSSVVKTAPKLDEVIFGAVVSGDFRKAKSKQAAIDVYRSMADLSAERNKLDKKRRALQKGESWFRDEYVIRINKGIAEARGKKLSPIDVPAGLKKNATDQANYYSTIASIFDTTATDLTKIEVPRSQREPAAYVRSIIKDYADMYHRYAERSTTAKCFGDLTMARFMFVDENDRAVNSIQDAVAVFGDTIVNRSLENSALQATISQDFSTISTDSSARATLAATVGYYQRYALSSFTIDERGSEEYAIGGMKYALFEIENKIKSSDISKMQQEQLLGLNQQTMDAIQWSRNSDRIITDALFNQRSAIADSMTYSGYSLQSKYIYDGQEYAGNIVDIEHTYEEIKAWLEDQYPYSKSMEVASRKAAQKSLDTINLTYAFYRDAEPINKKIRAVVTEAYQLSKKQSVSDADRQRIAALTAQTNQLKKQYKKLSNAFVKKTATSDAPEVAYKVVQELRLLDIKNEKNGTYKRELSEQFYRYFESVKR